MHSTHINLTDLKTRRTAETPSYYDDNYKLVMNHKQRYIRNQSPKTWILVVHSQANLLFVLLALTPSKQQYLWPKQRLKAAWKAVKRYQLQKN